MTVLESLASLLQVIRSGQKLVGKKSSGGQKQGGGGYFSGWFGRKAKKDELEPEESKETHGTGRFLQVLKATMSYRLIVVPVVLKHLFDLNE